ncbi:MAG: DEAD/DEAH box helicase, partial [Erysipelotrichaceae bacterium]
YQDVSPAEHAFEQRFAETYGSEYLIALQREYPLVDLDNRNGFIDYVIETKDGLVGFEVNGISYHHPLLAGKQTYLRQLQKQNAAIKSGLRLYRFSSQDTRFAQKMQEQFKLMIGDKHHILARTLVEKRRGYRLYEHQADIINQLKRAIHQGDKSALVVLPTATGKATIVEELILDRWMQNRDAKMAIIGPNRALMEDWRKRVTRLRQDARLSVENIEIMTYQRFYRLMQSAHSNRYDAIFVDEAHHAVASTMRKSLQYFTPNLLLGVTATPDRLDRQRLEEIFGTYSSPLLLEEAMEQGLIAKTHVYRIETNLDLSVVRYNGKSFVNADLERSICVDSRNQLIVEVLQTYFVDGPLQNKKGIVFCVNVEHAKKMEKALRAIGLDARAVAGNIPQSQQYIASYQTAKSPQFLCTCNMISEGWDAPQTSVLVMARPTLSKVLYLQQLGRGLRNHPNKEALYVIDVVDTYGALLKPWSMHSLMHNPSYVPFGDIMKRYHVDDVIQIEGLVETIERITPVDLFTFEEQYGEYLGEEEFARKLYITTSTLKNWIKKGEVIPSLLLPFGSKHLAFFEEHMVDSIRTQKGLQVHDETTLHQDFLDFCSEYSYTFSFKMTFMLSLLKAVDRNGEAKIQKILALYQRFYLERHALGLQVDKANCVYSESFLQDEVALQKNMLSNPFEKFERKQFVLYSQELGVIGFHPKLWRELTMQDKQNIQTQLLAHLEQYYKEMDGVQAIPWLVSEYEF